jgi:hypothetical protein
MAILAMAAVLVAGGVSVAMATLYIFDLQKTLNVPGYTKTYAYGLNDTGQIVGTCEGTYGSRGFLYDIGSDTYTTFNVQKPGATYTKAYGINNNRQVVGSYYDDDLGRRRCYLYNGLGYTTFDPPGIGDLISPELTGINEAGHMVGYLSSYGPYQGFLYTSGFKNLERLNGDAIPYGINDSGHLVGDDGFSGLGFFFDGLSYQNINHPTSGLETFPRGLNNNDLVVGLHNFTNPKGFLYDQTNFSAINIIGAEIVFPWDINNLREIVGYYTDSSGNIHGFYGKANPIFLPGPTHAPVPPSMLLLATGLLGLAGLGYRRRGR